MDQEAASPLVVLSTFVGVAIVVTVGVMLLIVDAPERDVQLVLGETTDGSYLEVVAASGGVRWDDLDIALLDAAGLDRASTYLEVPDGTIEVGQRISFTHEPAAGTYLLQVTGRGGLMLQQQMRF